MKNSKIMFLVIIFFSSIMAISSNSWMMMWVSLEINLMSVIPIMSSKNNLLSVESSIKYFITQALASSILITVSMILMLKTNLPASSKSPLMMMMNSSLLMKMGMAPFHFWFPEVMEGLSWSNCLIFMTWLKLAPMVLIMNNSINTNFFSMIIVLGLMISGVMSFNQTSMRKLLTYSSINNMSWMMASIMVKQTIWIWYFVLYAIFSVNIVMTLNKKNISIINQMFSLLSNKPLKIYFVFNFFNLSGMPPLLGFLPKWMIIEAFINLNMIFIPTIMVISTLLMVFIYVKIMMTSLLLNIEQMQWTLKTTKIKSIFLSIVNLLNLLSLILVTLLFNVL